MSLEISHKFNNPGPKMDVSLHPEHTNLKHTDASWKFCFTDSVNVDLFWNQLLEMCLRQDWCVWYKTGVFETRFMCLKQNRYVWDKTDVFETRLVCWRQNRCVWDKTDVFETKPVCLRQDWCVSGTSWSGLTVPVWHSRRPVNLYLRRWVTFTTHMSPMSVTCHLCQSPVTYVSDSSPMDMWCVVVPVISSCYKDRTNLEFQLNQITSNFLIRIESNPKRSVIPWPTQSHQHRSHASPPSIFVFNLFNSHISYADINTLGYVLYLWHVVVPVTCCTCDLWHVVVPVTCCCVQEPEEQEGVEDKDKETDAASSPQPAQPPTSRPGTSHTLSAPTVTQATKQCQVRLKQWHQPQNYAFLLNCNAVFI